MIDKKITLTASLLFCLSAGMAQSQSLYNLSPGTNPMINVSGESFGVSWPTSSYAYFEIYSTDSHGWSELPWNYQYFWQMPDGDYFIQIQGCYDDDYYCDFFANVTVRVTNSNQAPPTANYQIRRHSTASITQAEADSILQEATDVFALDDHGGDFRCPVRFQRSGGIVTFTSGDGSIDTQSEWDSMQPGINIVSDINFCGGLNPTTIGCANLPGNVVAVERSYADDILWAHEIGHNFGLQHVSSSTNVMNPTILTTALNVTRNQCVTVTNNL